MTFLENYQYLFEATPLKNKGFIAEALVAIAIFHKFKRKGGKVFYADLEKYIKSLRKKYTVGSLKEKGITIIDEFSEVKDLSQKNIKDKIYLRMKMTNRSLEYLMGHPGDKGFEPSEGQRYSLEFGEEMYSAVAFVNSERIQRYIEKVTSNSEKNIVKITCDGMSDNNKIKTDVYTEIDGRRIPSFDFSIKTKNTEQLSQHSDAQKKDVQIRFWKELCGIDVSKYFIEKRIDMVEDIHDFFEHVTKLINDSLTSQKEDAIFIQRLGEGIKHAATLGGDLILLSIDGTTKGLFRTFSFNSFVDALVLTEVDLTCKMSPDKNAKQSWIKIYATDNDSPSGVLIKIRYRNDNSMNGIVIEKGPLLERLTSID